MKVAKIKGKEQKREIIPAEDYSFKSLLKILFIILVIFGIFYLVTTLLVRVNEQETNDPVTVIDSTKITLSQLLNRNENEYYVIATKASLYESSYMGVDYIGLYKNYITEYKQDENALSFYYVDLDNALNKKYFSDELNLTDNVSELKINDEVLFKINDGKIEKTYVGRDKILDKLSRL